MRRQLILLVLLAFAPLAAADPPAWPADPAGLLFCYRSPRDIVAFEADGTLKQAYAVVPSDLRPSGFTYPAAGGGLVLVQGRYLAKGLSEFLAAQLPAAPAVTLEVLFTPAAVPAPAAGVVAALGGPDGLDLALVQDPAGLAIELRGAAPQRLALVPAVAGPMHVVATIAGGSLAATVDGVAIAAQPAALTSQAAPDVVFGAARDGSRPWSGELHAFALYRRAVDAAAHRAALLARLAARPVIPRSEIEAEVVEVTPTPAPATLAQYYRGLVVCTYRVLATRSGPAPPAIIKVAHWGVMANRKLAVKDLKPGDKQVLSVEPFEAHLYLKPEHTSESLEDHLDAPVYYEVSGWSLRTALAATP